MTAPQTIVLESDAHAPAELEAALRGQLAATDVQLEIRPSDSPFRVDPTILVALISAGASALAALITGAFALAAREKTPSGVRIETEDGLVVELPGTTRPEGIAEIVGRVRGRAVRRIRIEELD